MRRILKRTARIGRFRVERALDQLLDHAMIALCRAGDLARRIELLACGKHPALRLFMRNGEALAVMSGSEQADAMLISFAWTDIVRQRGDPCGERGSAALAVSSNDFVGPRAIELEGSRAEHTFEPPRVAAFHALSPKMPTSSPTESFIDTASSAPWRI